MQRCDWDSWYQVNCAHDRMGLLQLETVISVRAGTGRAASAVLPQDDGTRRGFRWHFASAPAGGWVAQPLGLRRSPLPPP